MPKIYYQIVKKSNFLYELKTNFTLLKIPFKKLLGYNRENVSLNNRKILGRHRSLITKTYPKFGTLRSLKISKKFKNVKKSVENFYGF